MQRVVRFCLVLLGVIHVAGAAGVRASERPSLVAIVTDDQGCWAMGAYGNEEIHTPNMDRIAREGALLENAFVSTPVCSPSRANYLTGRYSTECGITDWISPLEAQAGLGLKDPTWVQVLKRHGYRTALVGKWHLGELPDYHPTKFGFDHFFGFLGGGNQPMDPTLEVEGETRKLEGPLPDLLTDDAIGFIRASRDEPFAVLLHYRAPHGPYAPVPDEDNAHYVDLDPTVPEFPAADVEKLKAQTRAYYASISSVDRNVGRLLDALDELELAHNTLVVFTSDHGYNLGRHGISTKGNGHWLAGGVNGPKRPNMWDTSIRTPMAMRWPAVIEPGTRIEHLVSHLDMYRFVLGALDVPVPDDCRAQGVDFSPLLRGEPLPPREAIFGQYDLHNNGLAYMRMIRTPRWKYVRHFHARNMDELYDLENDPDERRNLLRNNRPRNADHQQVFESLQRQLADWMQSIDDPLLSDAY
jgi:uncharacterized sulfatase